MSLLGDIKNTRMPNDKMICSTCCVPLASFLIPLVYRQCLLDYVVAVYLDVALLPRSNQILHSFVMTIHCRFRDGIHKRMSYSKETTSHQIAHLILLPLTPKTLKRMP